MAKISAKTEYALSFPSFHGGINLSVEDYNMSPNESPEMANLVWRNGMLASRKGQKYLMTTALGKGVTCYKEPWHGHIIAHVNYYLYDYEIANGTATQLCTVSSLTRGSFFMYDGNLYYKTVGSYKKIVAAYNALTQTWSFTASNVAAYTPVIVINGDHATGSGDVYQPENRYSPLKTIWYNAASGEREFYLPVVPDTVTKVVVDGVELATGWGYNSGHNSIIFDTAPPVTNPPTNNTVRITYSKANTDAYNSINDCRYATVYGGSGELCVIMAGATAQPNAYFWSGNSNVAMDPGYFPMEQYQLTSSFDDEIVGFGRQQASLVVFKQRSIGKAALEITELNGRNYIAMPYIPINSEIGCKYPWSIQLVQNNLVWATTSGIYLLGNTDEAGENEVICLSYKINGTLPGAGAPTRKNALLYDLSLANIDDVCSADDEHNYYIMANQHAWVWNYDISVATNPSWFYMTGMKSVALSYKDNEIYGLESTGRLIGQQWAFNDFGQAINKFIRIPTQNLDGYDCLKNVNSVIITLGTEVSSIVSLKYYTDYETRFDLTALTVTAGNNNCPMPFRRRAMCRRVKNFAFALQNNRKDEDLELLSAQIFFNKQGRLR